MRVVIIGSNGYIGRRLSARLAELGHDVHGLSSSDGTGLDPESGLFREGFALPPGVEAVIYLAQSPYYRSGAQRRDHLRAVNAASAIQAAELASRTGAVRFVYTSTGSVYRPSLEPLAETAPLRRDDAYAASKIEAEEGLTALAGKIEVNVVRLFGVYGPGQQAKLIPALLARTLGGEKITLERNPADPTDLDGLKVSWCYIDDVTSILGRLVERGGPLVMNLAGPRPVSVRETALLMAEMTSRRLDLELTDRFRSGDLIADISLLENHFHPEFTSFEDGLAAVVEHELKTGPC